VKSIISSESATAETTAPPRPWTARAAIRHSCDEATPHASECGGEEPDAGQEHAPVAEEVAQPAAEQQEAAEGQQIRVHDPGKRRLREAEVVPDRRQRDVHDRAVKDDHEVSETEDVKREPTASHVQRGHWRFPFGAVIGSQA
jgi:hypothetical protein